jgi:SAM-dependent methyltransferase
MKTPTGPLVVNDRAAHEVSHGEWLAASDPEYIWGWGSAAGRRRAARRGALIAARAALGPGDRVLEIGCGTGLFTSYFAESGAAIVAVDISEPLLVRARSRNLPADRVTFLCRRFEDCALEGPFDAVVGSSILHHLELDAALGRIRELLKPAGRIAFAEPNMLNPQIAVQKNVPAIKRWLGDSPDETAFVRWRIANRLVRAGFEAVEVTPFDWLHPSTPPPLIPAVSAVGRVIERLPVVREFAGSLLMSGRLARRS